MEKEAWTIQVHRLERQRLIICLPLAFAFLIVYFHRLAAGVVSDSIMRDFAITRAAELGFLSSLYFYTYAACQIPAGIFADFYGPRRTITIAVTIAGVGAIAFGWAPNLVWLYGARLMVGLGVAFVYINIIKFIAEWFRTREFGTMCGISVFVGNIGALLAATPLAVMVENFGWRLSFYIIGACTLLVAAGCWLMVRDRPELCGLPAIAEVERREGVLSSEPMPATNVVASVRTVLGNPYTWPPFFVGACLYGVFMAFSGIWGMPYFMQVYGMSRVEAANYVMVLSAGYMVGGPLLGLLSDRARTRRLPFIGGTVLALTAWLVLTFWNHGQPPLAALYPLCFLIGVGMAATALNLACAKEVNPPNMAGIAAGVANMGPFAGAALVQPAFGYVLDLYWDGTQIMGIKVYPPEAFEKGFWLCAVILIIALIFALVTKETNCTNAAARYMNKHRAVIKAWEVHSK